MSMNATLIAVKADVPALCAALPEIFPELEFGERGEGFADDEAASQWAREHGRYRNGRRPAQDDMVRTFFVYPDGEWAVLMDAEDAYLNFDEVHQAFGERFGRALVFTIGETSGVGMFACYEGGTLRRALSGEGDAPEAEGAPLPQEPADYEAFGCDEVWALMHVFGLSEEMPVGRGVVLQFTDRADYSHLRKASAPAAARKPWWKFW